MEVARHGAELGNADLEVGEQLEQERLELLIGPVDLVDQEHRRLFPADGGEQGPFEEVFLGEHMLLDRVGVLAGAFARLDGEELALIVPLVEGGVLIQALVALQADELGLVQLGERLGDRRLAHPRLAFQQQWALQEIHQPDRHGQIPVGHIASRFQALGDLGAVQGHAKSAKRARPAMQDRPGRCLYPCSPSFSATVQVRQLSCGMAIWVEPRNLKASLTALAKQGTPPTLGLSPTPLAPIG